MDGYRLEQACRAVGYIEQPYWNCSCSGELYFAASRWLTSWRMGVHHYRSVSLKASSTLPNCRFAYFNDALAVSTGFRALPFPRVFHTVFRLGAGGSRDDLSFQPAVLCRNHGQRADHSLDRGLRPLQPRRLEY